MENEHFNDQDPVYFPNVPVRAVPASNEDWELNKLPINGDDVPDIPEDKIFQVQMVSA
jgi:hypothetical protein